MSEDALNDDPRHSVVRVGDTVRRPVGWWTPAVHGLLQYLESVGFPYSPRVLGFDDQGREVLTFIAGDSGGDGWAKIVDDDGLRAFARLLRAYHDAVSGYRPSPQTTWAYRTGCVANDEVVCHGDFGVWNTVWQGSEPVGIVDWDFVLPAHPRYDLLYALEFAAPFRDDETSIRWHHFPVAPDRKHRIAVFADAYGITDLGDVVGGVAAVQRQVGQHVAYLADRGLQPQVDWVAGGELAAVEKRAAWTEANRRLFE